MKFYLRILSLLLLITATLTDDFGKSTVPSSKMLVSGFLFWEGEGVSFFIVQAYCLLGLNRKRCIFFNQKKKKKQDDRADKGMSSLE